MIKGFTHVHLGSIWYQEVSITQTSFLVWTFFCRFLKQTGSSQDLLGQTYLTLYNFLEICNTVLLAHTATLGFQFDVMRNRNSEFFLF